MATMRASALELSSANLDSSQAGIAQSVEQLIRNEKVVGSIPISGTILRWVARGHGLVSLPVNVESSTAHAKFHEIKRRLCYPQ